MPPKREMDFKALARELAEGSIVTQALARFIEQVIQELHETQIAPLRTRAEATEAALAAVTRERDGAYLTSQQAAQSYSNLMRVKDDIDAQRQAAEAALASATKEVERLKIALADAIRRPMGVIPASAEGLITYADVAAAEERRADKLRDDLTKEPPHA